jgi:hypothetical protein
MLSNACRTFCFKFYNNILPYNHVLSHFVRGQGRNCTFCDLSGNQDEEDETPLHLFYNCVISENLRNTFFIEFLGTTISRQEFFTIFDRENLHSNKILLLVTTLFRKFLWDCKFCVLRRPCICGSNMKGDLIDLRDNPDLVPAPAALPGSAAAAQMETDQTTPDLGNVFKKCKIARETSISSNFTVFGAGSDFNYGTGKPPRIGNLDMAGDTDVIHTFHGARMCRGNKTTNECISLSLDPRNFVCIGCKEPHKLGSKGPVVICFADQNFVPFIQDGLGGCIAIVRIENASLSELVDFSFELLENLPLEQGSVVLYGSASFLYRVGVSVYAREWVDCITKIHICPLIPIIRENCPGSMARDLEQLAAWVLKVYSNNIDGLSDCWRAVMQATRAHSQEGNLLSQGEHYKLPLPTGLLASSLAPHCYTYSSSCPILLHDLSPRATEELVWVLSLSLSSNFSAAICPDNLVQRGTLGGDTKPFSNHIVVLGASNARNLCPYLEGCGFSVTNLAVQGWVASEKNITALITKLQAITVPSGAAIIID